MTFPGTRTAPSWAGQRLALVIGVVAALVVSLLSAPPPPAYAATAAPTGGFALQSGLGGQVDERTGQLAVTVPITATRGRGTAGVSIALTWQQGRALGTVDRSGWGAGWTVGNTFVDVTGQKRVYPASGGSYLLDPTEPSGLKHYKLRDLTFATESGTLPAGGSAPAVAYAYRLRYDDGRADYFDVAGNLAAREDRFGNRTVLAWQPRAGGQWRPISITDSYGLATTFDYGTANQVTVRAPKRSDGLTPATTIRLTNGAVSAVTDPVGSVTSFGYSQPSGSPRPLISLVVAPTGARTVVSYQSPSYQPGLVAVRTLAVTDAASNPLTPVQIYDLDPPGNNRHNYTGFGRVGTLSEQALFESGDGIYTYRTGLTTGGSTTVSSYDALHRLVSRTVSVTPALGQPAVLAQTQTMTYPVAVQPPGGLPATFARPTQVRLAESAATSAASVTPTAARTTTTSTAYDDHGRITSATDELGTRTSTTYDGRFGLVTARATVGTDGSRAELTNTLTDDGRSIATSTTAVGEPGNDPTARQTVSYGYDDSGQLTTRRLAWAPGQQPTESGPGGGPDEIVTRFARTVDAAAGTLDLTITTGDGTEAAQPRTASLDLASGLALAATDGLGRRTTMGYDAIGRRVRSVTPDGSATTTAYTPTSTTVTTADGRISRTSTDLLGRTTAVTDNVQAGKPGTDPSVRILARTSYSADGMSVTASDRAGRTSRRLLDAFGRTVSETGPSGITTLTKFDDGAAHSRVTTVLPEGSTDASLSTATSFDDVDRPIGSRTSYAAGDGSGGRPGQFVSEPTSARTFDGLGQPTTSAADDLTVTPDRSGPGGVSTAATATPQDTDDFPGEPITATTVHSLSGATVSRTLAQGDQRSAAVAVVYDASGNVVSAVDPENRTTSYTYAADGQPLTKTSPSGAVTTHRYDARTGLLTGTTVTAPGRPTRTVSFTRVPAGQLGAGKIATVSDGTDTISYGYDADGHRTSVRYPDGTTTGATYNDAGQLVTATDVTGAVTSYAYDPADSSMTSAVQRRAGVVIASVSYRYDALGRVQSTTRGNGTVTTATYTGNNLVASLITTDAAAKTLESHGYTYDSHRNPLTRTDSYPAGSPVAVAGGPTIWSTVYDYDAYDRLTSSSIYPGPLVGGQPSGPAATSTRYTVDVGGDVTVVRTTRRLAGPRPTVVTSTSTNSIDDSGRLTTQQMGSATATQEFDDDGRVTRRLDGTTTRYTADGAPAQSTRPDGSSLSYTRWPDGSRRSIATTGADGRSTTVTYHYGPDGVLVNDATSDASTGAGRATTASYLLTAGREARTLLTGTSAAGSVAGTPAAPTVRGSGVGYYLRDRHSSVTGLLDAAGAVTGGYAYTDYGASARADGRPITVAGADGGRTNPYTFLGATPRGPVADSAGGLLAFAARQYDPASGRFASPDPVDSHNLYQGFRANPVVYTDLGGATAAFDALIDVGFAFVFLVTAFLTGGAAVAAFGAVAAAAEAGVAITGAVVANAAAAVVGTVANVAGAVTSGLLAADDLSKSAGKGEILSEDDRETVTLVNAVAGVTAGAAGFVQGVTDAAVETLEAAAQAKLAPAPVTPFSPDPDVIREEGWLLREVRGDPQAEAQLPVPERVARPDPPAQPAVDPAAEPAPPDPGEDEPAALGSLFGDDDLAAPGQNDVPDDPVEGGEERQPEILREVLPEDNAGGEPDQQVVREDPPVQAALNVVGVANPAVNEVRPDVVPVVQTNDEINTGRAEPRVPQQDAVNPDVNDFTRDNVHDTNG